MNNDARSEVVSTPNSAFDRYRHRGGSVVFTALVAALMLSLAFFPAAPVRAAGQGRKDQTGQSAARSKNNKPNELEVVEVTARRMTENLQDTPIAISALNGDQLEARGFSNVLDMTKVSPNVTLQQAGASGGKSAVAYIRGVGQSDFTLAFEPGVGFYMDDVYYGTIFGSIFDLTDVDHVEVLRGPQGTLFGKNNEGGAVRVFTKQPKGDNSGYIEGGLGNYGRYRIKGAYDFSLIPDKLLLRVSGGFQGVDGYVTRYDFVCKHPNLSGNLQRITTRADCKLGTEGGDDMKAFRANMIWRPTDDLEVRFSGDFLDDKGGPAASKTVAITTAGPLGDYNTNVLLNPNSGFYTGVPLDQRFLTDNPYSTYSTFKDTSTGFSLDPVNNVKSWGVSNTIIWNSPMGVQFKNILAYRAYQGAFAVDFSGAPLINAMYSNPEFVHHQFTEELNISGTAFDNKLDWVMGAYYYDGYSRQGMGPVILTSLEIIPPNIVPFCPLGCYGLNFYTNDPVVVKNQSGFIHGEYHFTDKLSLEAGVRYSNESKKYTFTREIIPLNPPNPLFTPAFDPDYPALNGFAGHPSATSTTSRFDPKVALQYQWTPDIMTYVQYATGYKGGGINPHPVYITDVQPFGEEDLTSYEIGAKTQWFDDRLRANLAGFISDYKNLQITVVAPNAADIVQNAGHIRISGIEGEFDAEPTDGLLLNASFGYLHYHTIDLGYAAGVPGGPTKTSKPAYIPTWKFNMGMQYAIPLNDLGMLTPRLDWTFQTKVYNDPSNNPMAKQGAYGLLDARVTWDSPDSNWRVAVQVKNALDKAYYINMFDDSASVGAVTGQPGWPRTVMASVRRNF